jgi:hypothetical protein
MKLINLLLGVKWRQLVHHGINNELFNHWQFGGLPGRDAIPPNSLYIVIAFYVPGAVGKAHP